LILFGVATLVFMPGDALAQREAPRLPWLGFSANGVWRGRARAVRATRARLLASRQFGQLNAPAFAGTFPSTVVSGTIVEPVVLFKYQDTPAGEIVADTVAYDSVLFATTPPNGRPYTVRTYYEQLSTLNSNPPLMTITGKSLGFVSLSQNEVAYAGTPGTCSGNPYGTANCNGIFSFTAFQGLQSGLRESLRQLDNAIDWTQFSQHGDTIDLVVFVQPARDGACGGYNGFTNGSPASNNHIWAHRSRLLDHNLFNDSAYTTHDGKKILDYIVQSGVGGSSACDSTAIMPPGTVAHETGHGFDLPDLYDTQGSSEGVGEYSLMGSGNYTSPFSPSRMDAWSLSQLGWVTVAPLTAGADYQFGGAPVSDTTFYVRVTGTNPRGEYFLLENRQRLQSDSALIRIHGGGGLLLYHVDSAQIAQHGFDADNAVNSGPIHGVEVEQADGRRDLDFGTNRGDAGDPYPGSTGNTVFSFNTNPAAVKNSDGAFVGFAVDSIQQLAGATKPMLFRLRVGQPLFFAATLHGTITANPATTSGSFLPESSLVTMTAVPDGGSSFLGWSGDTVTANATLQLSMTHPYADTANFGSPTLAIATADTLPAAIMGATYLDTLHATGGTGSYTWQVIGQPPPSLSLTTSGVLTGTPSHAGTFSLQARVTSASLQVTDTFTLITTTPTLSTPAVVAQILNGSGTLTAGELTYLDLLGNQNNAFDVGDFLAWVNATGAPPVAVPPKRAATKGRGQ